jgi:Zn-dependent protease with chaperone function
VRFRQHQDDARRATRRLLVLFLLTVALTVLCANAALALIWRLHTGGLSGFPPWFFQTNTLVTLGFILGGCWIETQRLRQGGAHVAQLLGGRELREPRDLAERRLRNVVDELAIASGLKAPRVFLLDRDDAINAFAAGWEQQDSVVAVTRGALERLTRDELQGVLAHEFGHVLNGDTRLNMRLIGYVFGLQMIFNFGRSLTLPADTNGRRGAGLLPGLALMAAGFMGWMAGRLLQAAVSRQREFLADAHAVQFTRLPHGIGGALRKIAHHMANGEARLHSAHAAVVAPLLLSADGSQAIRWLATHPPLIERLRRIYGRVMPPLEAQLLEPVDAPLAGPTGVPAFVPMHGNAGLAASEPMDRGSAGLDWHVDPAVPAAPACAPEQAEQAEQAEQVLHALRAFTPPELLQAAVLAFLVPAPATPEHGAWRRFAGGVSGAATVLEAVWHVPPRRRQPWFEALLWQAAGFSIADQRVLRQQALQLVGADGRLALHELLAALQIHHDLSTRREHLTMEPRHLALPQRAAEVALVTRALGSLLPPAQAGDWLPAVLAAAGLPPAPEVSGAPSMVEVRAAIRGLRDLAMTQTPALAKSWVACQPVQPMPLPMAEALRALCLLIDTPMPASLIARFDRLDLTPLPPEPAGTSGSR